MSSYKELQEKIAQLQVEAEKVRKQEISNVIAELKAKMVEFGIGCEDLGCGGKTRGRKKSSASASPAKYRNPATGETWTGKGRRPKWIVDAEQHGKGAKDFLIS